MYPVRKKGMVLRSKNMPASKLDEWLKSHLNSEIADIKMSGRQVLVLYYESVPYHPLKK